MIIDKAMLKLAVGAVLAFKVIWLWLAILTYHAPTGIGLFLALQIYMFFENRRDRYYNSRRK